MQIHELDNFIGEVGAETVLAIDDGTETMKIPATSLLSKALVVDANISALPVTLTNDAITEDMVCIKAELGTPSAQTGDWTVTTADGEATISGTVSGTTTLKMYLLASM